MTKTLNDFHMSVKSGQFQQGEIVVMLGQNGIIKPDDETIEMPRLNVSYKPQTIAPKFEGTVRDLLHMKLADIWTASLFKTEVLIPLDIESLIDNDV